MKQIKKQIKSTVRISAASAHGPLGADHLTSRERTHRQRRCLGSRGVQARGLMARVLGRRPGNEGQRQGHGNPWVLTSCSGRWETVSQAEQGLGGERERTVDEKRWEPLGPGDSRRPCKVQASKFYSKRGEGSPVPRQIRSLSLPRCRYVAPVYFEVHLVGPPSLARAELGLDLQTHPLAGSLNHPWATPPSPPTPQATPNLLAHAHCHSAGPPFPLSSSDLRTLTPASAQWGPARRLTESLPGGSRFPKLRPCWCRIHRGGPTCLTVSGSKARAPRFAINHNTFQTSTVFQFSIRRYRFNFVRKRKLSRSPLECREDPGVEGSLVREWLNVHLQPKHWLCSLPPPVFFLLHRKPNSTGTRKPWGWSTGPSFGATSSPRFQAATSRLGWPPTGKAPGGGGSGRGLVPSEGAAGLGQGGNPWAESPRVWALVTSARSLALSARLSRRFVQWSTCLTAWWERRPGRARALGALRAGGRVLLPRPRVPRGPGFLPRRPPGRARRKPGGEPAQMVLWVCRICFYGGGRDFRRLGCDSTC